MVVTVLSSKVEEGKVKGVRGILSVVSCRSRMLFLLGVKAIPNLER
jgi:hypothetical protein